MTEPLNQRCRAGTRLLYSGLLCLACLICAASPRALAQDGSADAVRDASARLLFQQGVTLAEHGDWVNAADRFRRALALRSSPVIAYNLASALSELGKLVEASETLRRVLTDDNAEPALRHLAVQLSRSLSDRIARIVIDVQGQQLGDSVILDGHVMHAAQLSVEIPVDPGDHQLRLERAGQTVDLQTFALAQGARQELRLVAPPLSAATPAGERSLARAAPAALALPAPAPQREPQPSLFTRWWFWTGAAGVVVLGSVAALAAASGGSSRAEPAFQGNLAPGSVPVEVAP